MIKQFNVTISGQTYEVSVETVYGNRTPVSAPAAPVPAPAPVHVQTPVVSKPAGQPAAPVKSAEGNTVVSAPMPGNMWKVHIKEGQNVKKGDVIFILEAMKMENEIFAPCDGVISKVSVVEGAAVNSGETLCVIG